MFVRLILSSYSRLLAGATLALLAVALAGCNDTVAQKAEPPRPVLVATAHYEAETPERSFVGTVRPRIESDLGFRVAGKVAKRLVEVGQTVDVGQPLASLDEVDLKLQTEQAQAEQAAAVQAALATLQSLTDQLHNLQMQLQHADRLERQALQMDINDILKNQLPPPRPPCSRRKRPSNYAVLSGSAN